MKQYTKDEAIEIIAANKELTKEYEELKPYYDTGNLDHSSSTDSVSINFFNLIEDETKVVLQYCYEADDYDKVHELIVDSLEQAIVVIRDLEA
jgi:hypothetical protein